MAEWHYQANGHEFEQAPKDGDEQGGLACCRPWGRKEWDTTEHLNWTEPGESPAIQWLGLPTLTDKRPGFYPWSGKPQATQSGQKKKQNKINSLPSSREHGVTIRKEESVYYKLHLDIISALPIPPQSITSIKKPTRHTSFAEKNPRVCISENYPTDVTVILQMVYKPAGQYPCRQQGPWRANGYSHLITSRMWSLHLLVFCLDFRF